MKTNTKILKKSASLVAKIFLILYVAWGVFSFVDIVADNIKPNPEHSEYNLIIMMFEKFSEK